MCGLERTALATLALSALPAEIARDMRDNPRAVARLSHSALLLSMVLSMADALPVTHFGEACCLTRQKAERGSLLS